MKEKGRRVVFLPTMPEIQYIKFLSLPQESGMPQGKTL